MKGLASLLAVLLLLAGCGGGEEGTPEARVRDLIARGEQAAEARSLDFFEEIVADDYADSRGHTRKEVLRMLAGYFLRNRAVHLWVRVAEIRFEGEQRAQVTLFAGMAASPAEGLEQLLAMRGDLYRFDLLFELAGGERLVRADWRRARAGEL